MLKYIDLFAGLGGFHLALNKIKNTKCIFASDIDKNCQKVYELNFNMKVHGDITKINPKDIPNHDLLTGGFSCQPFSIGGKRKGLNDERGTMFDVICEIIKCKKPKFCVLENVKHIKTIDDGKVYRYIYEKINKLGYNIFDIILNPVDFGIPQNRERIFFIIIRKDLVFDKEKIYTDIINSKVKSHKILSSKVPEKYNISKELSDVFSIWNDFLRNIIPQKLGFPIRIEYFKKNGSNLKEVIKNNLLYKNNKKFIDKWLEQNYTLLNKKVIYGILEWQTGISLSKNININDFIIQLRQSGIRVKKQGVFPTLVAVVQTPIINKRFLTPRECARLQSFPETYKFLPDSDNITLKQLGNSVNVDVVYIVCKSLLKNYT